jgi:3-dehydroquinate synthase
MHFQPHECLSVDLAGHAHDYPIYIRRGVLKHLADLLPLPTSRKIFLVYDKGLPLTYLETVTMTLMEAGYCLHEEVVPQGEAAKSLGVLEELYASALKKGFTRHDAFLALGGGVVGDLTGFLADSYYRGARFIQVPTTLLSQVDSSVGGKVAVNFGEVKNCIGAFKQPDAVFIDPDVLETLPPRELQAGLAELFKYALIEKTALDSETPALDDEPLWEAFTRLGKRWPDELGALIHAACTIKAAVVMRDETESFPKDDARGRVCLNLGHTYAHAYEAYYGYGILLHGEAVAIGMLCALFAHGDHLAEGFLQAALDLMETLNILPHEAIHQLGVFPEADDLLAIMAKDKKVITSGTLRLVLPEGDIGTVVVKEVPRELAEHGITKAHAYLKARQ